MTRRLWLILLFPLAAHAIIKFKHCQFDAYLEDRDLARAVTKSPDTLRDILRDAVQEPADIFVTSWQIAARIAERLGRFSGSEEGNNLREALETFLATETDPLVRGEAALLLVESGHSSPAAIQALQRVASAPGFQKQKRTNEGSASAEFRVRGIDALLSLKSNSPEVVQALRALIFGQTGDRALLAAQLHVAYLLERGNSSPALVEALQNWTELEVKGERAGLIHQASGKFPEVKTQFEAMVRERSRKATEAQNEEVRKLNEGLATTPGFHGVVLLRDGRRLGFVDNRFQGEIKGVEGNDLFNVEPSTIRKEFARLYPTIAGYGGFELDEASRTFTVYFDRTANWGDYISSFGPYRVEIKLVSALEAEEHRQAMRGR